MVIPIKDYSLFFIIKQDNIWRKQRGTEEAVGKNIYLISTSNIVKEISSAKTLIPQVSMRAFQIVNTFSWITLTSFIICRGFHRTVLWTGGCQQPVNLTTLLKKQRHYHKDHLRHQILLHFNTNVHKLWPLSPEILPSVAIFSFSQKDPLQPV